MELETFKIYLPRAVHSDLPFPPFLVAKPSIHDAVANQHGAVAVVLEGGELLGVKPDEYEHIG